MGTWMDFKTGKSKTLPEMFERLTDEQLLGASYALRILHTELRQGRKLAEEYYLACHEVMTTRPGLRKEPQPAPDSCGLSGERGDL